MTYSIIGLDHANGEIGVAVQSQAFNTGAGVPWARAGVGAIATQASTDRRYGWRGLELMADGHEPQQALDALREADELAGFRQVAMMSTDGRAAQWTGTHCVPDAGCAEGDCWLAQANMVATPRVWQAMGDVFSSSEGALAERLMAALDAAEAEGGDWRGRGAAAIVVVPVSGDPWERIVDLRVEESGDPLTELRRLVDRGLGYRAANRADAGRAHVGRARGLPDPHVRLLALHDAVDEGRFADAERIVSQLEADNSRWIDYVEALAKHPELEAFARFLERRA